MTKSKLGNELVMARLRLCLKKKREMSQSEIAKSIGISQSYLSELEKNVKVPTNISTINKILKFYEDVDNTGLKKCLERL